MTDLGFEFWSVRFQGRISTLPYGHSLSNRRLENKVRHKGQTQSHPGDDRTRRCVLWWGVLFGDADLRLRFCSPGWVGSKSCLSLLPALFSPNLVGLYHLQFHPAQADHKVRVKCRDEMFTWNLYSVTPQPWKPSRPLYLPPTSSLHILHTTWMKNRTVSFSFPTAQCIA